MPSSEITLEALAKRRREEEAAQQAAAADTAPQFTDGAGTQSTVDAAFAATEEAAASLTAAATRTAAEIAAEPGVVVPASDTVAVPNVPSVTSAALVSRSDSPPSELSEDDRRRVEEIKSTIDMLDSNSTMQFGVGAQRNLANFSEAILNQVKVKDAGEVGEAMNNLLANVNSLGIDKFNDRTFRKRGLFRRSSAAIKKFMGRYESVETQIQRIQDQLDGARVGLIRDIGMYDSLYQKNLDYFNELQLYIIAGEEKIAELRNVTIPNLRRQVQEDPDPMNVQLVNDFEEAVDRFEKKVHDLRISRTMAIQTAPQIRLIQNNDKLLVDKIQTAILNVIPLWKSQIVMALGLARQRDALQMQQAVSRTTNELLVKNAALLKSNTLEVQRESQRSIVDIETLKKVNAELISTIDETIKIQNEGRAKRIQAAAELTTMEQNLRTALLTASSGSGAGAQDAAATSGTAPATPATAQPAEPAVIREIPVTPTPVAQAPVAPTPIAPAPVAPTVAEAYTPTPPQPAPEIVATTVDDWNEAENAKNAE